MFRLRIRRFLKTRAPAKIRLARLQNFSKTFRFAYRIASFQQSHQRIRIQLKRSMDMRVFARDQGRQFAACLWRFKAPKACRELAALVAREHAHIHRALELDADALVRLLERCDAIRKPERFAEVLQACEADFCGRAGFEKAPYPQAEHLRQRLSAARSVDAAKIAAMYPNAPAAIKAAVHQARVAAVQS